MAHGTASLRGSRRAASRPSFGEDRSLGAFPHFGTAQCCRFGLARPPPLNPHVVPELQTTDVLILGPPCINGRTGVPLHRVAKLRCHQSIFDRDTPKASLVSLQSISPRCDYKLPGGI